MVLHRKIISTLIINTYSTYINTYLAFVIYLFVSPPDPVALCSASTISTRHSSSVICELLAGAEWTPPPPPLHSMGKFSVTTNKKKWRETEYLYMHMAMQDVNSGLGLIYIQKPLSVRSPNSQFLLSYSHWLGSRSGNWKWTWSKIGHGEQYCLWLTTYLIFLTHEISCVFPVTSPPYYIRCT